MGKEMICVDTSVFIDYFRSTQKNKTYLHELSLNYDLAVSVITKLEIVYGAGKSQIEFWEKLLKKVTILPFHENSVEIAITTMKTLREENKIIGMADILIAATAISHSCKIATLNLKDFERIKNLNIIART